MPAGSGRYPSGQRGQTVNLLAYAFGGSNPPLATIVEPSCGRVVNGTRVESGDRPRVFGRRVTPRRGNSSAVERQPSKLGVAGSNPVSRSSPRAWGSSTGWVGRGRVRTSAHVAQLAERVLGKDEVSGSTPDMGSINIVGTDNTAR